LHFVLLFSSWFAFHLRSRGTGNHSYDVITLWQLCALYMWSRRTSVGTTVHSQLLKWSKCAVLVHIRRLQGNLSAATQKYWHNLRKFPSSHGRHPKSPLLVPVLSQINPAKHDVITLLKT
jgi:hypothetical protein